MLVTGAGGLLGRAVVDALLARGVPALGLGRSAAPRGFRTPWLRFDLLRDDDFRAAFGRATTVVHCASDPRRPPNDLRALERLLRAAAANGVVHFVFIGIAGIDRAAERYPYYAAKLAAERALANGSVPYSILRSTQFHPFVAYLLRRLDATFALVVPRGAVLQPVMLEFVAAEIVRAVLAGPQGRTADVHGPRAMRIDELGRSWLRARRRRVPVIELPLPVPTLRALASLQRVCGTSGGLSWDDWLASGAR